MNLKGILNRLIKDYRDLKQRLSNTYYISIGENCLTHDILKRFNMKSFATPYSHARSNIEYAIHLEKEKYCNLLTPEYLFYDYVGKMKVVRNKQYSKSDEIYDNLHLNGFEFTHHDVINNKNHRESYERKILRMLDLDNRKNLKFVYHYRKSKNMNIEMFICKAREFLSLYQKRNIKCEFIFFTQEIVSNKAERALLKVHNSRKIKGYVFRTLEIWGGDDQDVFWARKDNDLLLKMIKDI